MKYKPGDKVRIRNDLVEYEEYGSRIFQPFMVRYKGNRATIERVLSNGYNGYLIALDKGRSIWTDEMFENEMGDKMDNKSITVNMENLSEEERNTLLELIKKSNQSKSKVWKPEYKEDYYFINYMGEVLCDIWNIDDVDKSKYSIGNCFKTKEEAKFALEKQKVITELKRFAIEHNEGEIDWSDDKQRKYHINYSNICCKTKIVYATTVKYNTTYFTSQEIAEQAVQEIGEERLKKYYFEVNDQWIKQQF